jgi:hypothetical protein
MRYVFYALTSSENEMMIDYFYVLKQEAKQKTCSKKAGFPE